MEEVPVIDAVDGVNPRSAGAAAGEPIGLGVVGLGRAFTLLLPVLQRDPRIRLAGAADPRKPARDLFARDFGVPVHETVEQLCAQPDVEAVYIASPHQFHARHVALAAAAGRHVLVEKPMALSLTECGAIVDAVERSGIVLVVGPSHSFDAPVQHARRMIAQGDLGAVRMIHTYNYTTYLYRPRRPEELQTERGGGAVFNQAAHQVDIVRLLGGGEVASVQGFTGIWDPERPTEGAYSALLRFRSGAFASLTYSGYARFDSDEILGSVDEFGASKDPADYGSVRRHLRERSGGAEVDLKVLTNYGGARYAPAAFRAPPHHPQFGPLLVSTEHADLNVTPDGVWVYGDEARTFHPTPQRDVPRAEVIDELWRAVREGAPVVHGARWGRATTEVCLGLLQSAREGAAVALQYQVGVP